MFGDRCLADLRLSKCERGRNAFRNRGDIPLLNGEGDGGSARHLQDWVRSGELLMRQAQTDGNDDFLPLMGLFDFADYLVRVHRLVRCDQHERMTGFDGAVNLR